MAAKLKMLTLLQEMRGFALVLNRLPAPRSPGLFLAQLRLHGNQAAWHRRRLSIAIDPPGQPETPLQVKIRYVQQGPDMTAPAPAPERPRSTAPN